MRNRFKAQCFYCKRWFEKGEAYLHRDYESKKWLCHCLECHDKKWKEIKEKQVQEK